VKFASRKDGVAVMIHNDQFVPLSSLGWSGSLLQLIQSGQTLEINLETNLGQADWRPLEPSDLAAPIPNPPKIICVGLNYRDHALESGMAIPTQPVIFTRFNTTLTGPFDPIPHDASLTLQLDYEVELAVIVGKGGKRIPRETALEHVFGYSVCNDLSARDLQLGSDTGGQWTRGKNLDGTCPIGPWIVTRDEIADPQALKLGCSVNGQTLQASSTAEMIFGVQELVHRLSHWFTLEAGDIIITGTPVGVGFARKPPVFLYPGDVTRAWIEGIGEIENQIVSSETNPVIA
jgi:2-keto-4-pentenoate hydratase/2-oxohepta-3-ene-1,7-dioic acid hydratase in catechol pathway